MCVCEYSDWLAQYLYKVRVEDKLGKLRVKLRRQRGEKRSSTDLKNFKNCFLL